ncbi:hypothetical protein SELMODRAFT_402568 [Selaginella moellendorffii]|uniref:Uncharacterized protein n=1 Tax=Selaginella moellendorffii TaxID=88036 RepID=D8QR35_SELML|nr:hypothetical protein SELMODRAFT_402568 [Selaginella moellendorffii]
MIHREHVPNPHATKGRAMNKKAPKMSISSLLLEARVHAGANDRRFDDLQYADDWIKMNNTTSMTVRPSLDDQESGSPLRNPSPEERFVTSKFKVAPSQDRQRPDLLVREDASGSDSGTRAHGRANLVHPKLFTINVQAETSGASLYPLEVLPSPVDAHLSVRIAFVPTPLVERLPCQRLAIDFIALSAKHVAEEALHVCEHACFDHQAEASHGDEGAGLDYWDNLTHVFELGWTAVHTGVMPEIDDRLREFMNQLISSSSTWRGSCKTMPVSTGVLGPDRKRIAPFATSNPSCLASLLGSGASRPCAFATSSGSCCASATQLNHAPLPSCDRFTSLFLLLVLQDCIEHTWLWMRGSQLNIYTGINMPTWCKFFPRIRVLLGSYDTGKSQVDALVHAPNLDWLCLHPDLLRFGGMDEDEIPCDKDEDCGFDDSGIEKSLLKYRSFYVLICHIFTMYTGASLASTGAYSMRHTTISRTFFYILPSVNF